MKRKVNNNNNSLHDHLKVEIDLTKKNSYLPTEITDGTILRR